MKKIVTLVILISCFLSYTNSFSIRLGSANTLSFSFGTKAPTTSSPLKSATSPTTSAPSICTQANFNQCSYFSAAYTTCPSSDQVCSCTWRHDLVRMYGWDLNERIYSCQYSCCHYDKNKDEVLEKLQVPQEVKDIFNFSYLSFYDTLGHNKLLIDNALWYRDKQIGCYSYVPNVVNLWYDKWIQQVNGDPKGEYVTPTCPHVEKDIIESGSNPVFKEAVREANSWKFTSLCFELIKNVTQKYYVEPNIIEQGSRIYKVQKIIEDLRKHIDHVACEKMKVVDFINPNATTNNALEISTDVKDEKFPFDFNCQNGVCEVVHTTPVPTTRATTTPVPTTRATTKPTTRATTKPTTRATTKPTTRISSRFRVLEQEIAMAEEASQNEVDKENALDVDWMD